MDTQDLAFRQHQHVFHPGNPPGEKNTRRVVALTAGMMVLEISAGLLFHSMALLADGWHMSTYAAALGITALAYALARRHASDTRFTFGTWKIEALGGFASAVILVLVALYMAAESIERFLHPLEILYSQALLVAVIGLLVNLASASLLRGHDHAGHGGQAHAHSDLNLLAAYTHVLADAVTSVLAIAALLGGRFLHWSWLDPAMGVVGAGVITVWAYGLLLETSRVLLDREMDHPLVGEIRDTIEADGDARVSDLHVLRVGPERFACIVSVVAHQPKAPEDYKALLGGHKEIVHATVEVCRCSDPHGH